MYEYLKDTNFLQLLEQMNIKVQYGKIILLDFNEKPIQEIQGLIKTGTLNINGSSAIRRSLNLTMTANEKTNRIEDIDNLISINKKIEVYVGYKNLIRGYEKYGDIIWFKCGLFIITSASTSTTVNDITINIQGQDKMVMLNGSIGGTLPADVDFKTPIIDAEGNEKIPTIYDIIFNAVYQYGNEDPSKIIISDLNKQQRQLVKFISKDNQNLFVRLDSQGRNNVVLSTTNKRTGYQKIANGENAGYVLTDYIFAPQLKLQAGDNVQSLLNKIVSEALNNYEYFYDVDGNFIFQEKKNYLNTSYTPIQELNSIQYFKNFSDTKYSYVYKNNSQNISIQNNPKYDNIKNDFIVLGEKSLSSGVKQTLKYHLVIEPKPKLGLAKFYMYQVYDNKNSWYYDFFEEKQSSQHTSYPKYVLVGEPSTEWREEIFRNALVKQKNAKKLNSYESELIAELDNDAIWIDTSNMDDPYKNMLWRTIYTYKSEWKVSVQKDKNSLVYWLDFIDTPATNQYSVSNIGWRTKVQKANKVDTLFEANIPDIVYSLTDDDSFLGPYANQIISKNIMDKLSISNQQASLFSIIKNLLYQHFTYNSTINISGLPKFYLEPNNLIYISDTQSGIFGSYAISTISLPLGITGNMTIQATMCNNRF